MGKVIEFPRDDSNTATLLRWLRESFGERLAAGGMSPAQVSRTLDSVNREMQIIARIGAFGGSVDITVGADGAQSAEQIVAATSLAVRQEIVKEGIEVLRELVGPAAG